MSVARLEWLGTSRVWGACQGLGLNLSAGVLGHLTFELAAALDFNFRVVQIARHAASSVNQNMVMANDVFSQNTMHINDLRTDVAGHTALGPI